MSSSPLTLITGGNGFIGYAVPAGTLRAGYHVRAAVRHEDAIEKISKAPSVQKYLSSGALTFALVPDNTKSGAYRESAKDCLYIIHIASPLPTVPGDLVSQAIAGNRAILEAAEATPSIKRVVFTASTSSIRPFERLLLKHSANQAIMSGRGDDVPALTAETKISTQPSISDDAPGFHRYVNSKIAATNFVHEYSVAHKSTSHFSIVNIMPGWTFGPEELAQSKQDAFKGSNIILGWLLFDLSLAPFLGLPANEDAPLLSETVHLDDVVEGHVNALDTDKVPGNYRNFLLCSDSPTGPVLMDAVDIVRKELPQEVKDGKIPFAGKLGTIVSKFDATPTEHDLLGHPFRPYSQQVKDTVKCGGGVGTFAVVLSLTSRAFPDGEIGGASLTFSSEGVSSDTCWEAIGVLHNSVPGYVDVGGIVDYAATGTALRVNGFKFPGKTKAQVNAILQPLTVSLTKLGIDYSLNVTSFPTFIQHFNNYFGPLPYGVDPSALVTGSRLIPRSVVLNNNKGLTATLQNITSSGQFSVTGLGISAPLNLLSNTPATNAVLPAWRTTLLHLVIYAEWNFTAPLSDKLAFQAQLTNKTVPSLKSLTPGSGAYLNEANFEQPNF